MDELSEAVLRIVVGRSPEGIVVCDARAADHPVLYVNAAFERMTGYAADELLGRNLRLLQGADRDQEGRRRLREAIARGEGCRALLRNSRKDGSPLWNEMELVPVRDESGALTHLVGFHRDAGERARTPERPLEGLPSWMREDRLTGLASRPWFEELLLREWATARRERRLLSVLLFDIEGLVGYGETFGRSATDACVRQVARVIASSYRRGVDVCGRFEGGTLAVLVNQPDAKQVTDYAAIVAQRVTDLRIHNPRDAVQKFISVSTGIASVHPSAVAEGDVRTLLHAAENALREARHDGRGRLRAVLLDSDQLPGADTIATTPNPG